MTDAKNSFSAVAAPENTLAAIAALYLDAYRGRDTSRPHRLNAWIRLLGDKPLAAITPEDIDTGMDTLANEPAKCYGGVDADGNPIFRKRTISVRAREIWPVFA